MAAKNQVTLTFAGDSSKLERAFDSVGGAAKTMSDDVGTASRSVGDSAASFDKTSAAVDGTYNSFDGLEALGRGTTDTMSGLSEIMKGNVLQGATDLTGGIAALASGVRDALLPALKTLATTSLSSATAMVKSAAMQTAAWVKLGVQSLLHAAKVALAWIIAMGPIALVIAAVVGLVVLIVKNWDTIWNITKKVWGAIWGFIKGLWDKVTGFVGRAIGVIKDIFFKFHPLGIIMRNWQPILEFFKSIPRKIGSALSTVARAISAPFRAAFNGIKSFWNSTVGGFGFSIPSWVPLVGGKEFRIPYLHTGGVVPGAPGQEVLAMLEAGERVTPAGRSGGATVIEIRSGGTRMDDLLVEVLRKSIRRQGGDVQVVLGG